MIHQTDFHETPPSFPCLHHGPSHVYSSWTCTCNFASDAASSHLLQGGRSLAEAVSHSKTSLESRGTAFTADTPIMMNLWPLSRTSTYKPHCQMWSWVSRCTSYSNVEIRIAFLSIQIRRMHCRGLWGAGTQRVFWDGGNRGHLQIKEPAACLAATKGAFILSAYFASSNCKPYP